MPSRRVDDSDDDDLEIDEAPTQIDPYKVLSLEKEATPDQIKKAYRKAALLHHPDKATDENKATAHVKFQEIAFAYAILSDERRRKRYDVTGRTEDSLDLDDEDFDWTSFYREKFAEAVNAEQIRDFAQEYKGSDEEREDLLAAYTRTKGNMTKIYELVMLSEPTEDDDRFRQILDTAIAQGSIEAFTNYTEESEKSRSNRIKKAKKLREDEAEEVAEAEKEIKARRAKPQAKPTKGSDSHADLAALIRERQKNRGQDFLANLEAKYARGNGKGTKRTTDEPREEAFAANRKKPKGKSRA